MIKFSELFKMQEAFVMSIQRNHINSFMYFNKLLEDDSNKKVKDKNKEIRLQPIMLEGLKKIFIFRHILYIRNIKIL